MKKTIFVILIIAIIAGACVLYCYEIGSFPVGYKNGHVIMYKQTCIDMSCSWDKQFYGKIDENACLEIGGKPLYVTAAGIVERGYNGCSPE